MKKQVKLAILATTVVVSILIAAVSVLTPVAVHTELLAPAPLGDSFTAQGTLVPTDSRILCAKTTGFVKSIPAGEGRTVTAGTEVVILDDTDSRRQLTDQIESLKLQQKTLRAQDGIQREQIAVQLAAAQLQYQQLFGEERGSADAAMEIAESAYLQAKRAYEEAEEAYDNLPLGSSGFATAKNQLFLLRQQMIAARENLVIAQNGASDSVMAYQKALIRSYQSQLGLLGDYGVGQLQLTIDYLTDKLDATAIAAPADGTVWEVYVQPGEFVAENQPVVKLFGREGMKIETSLLSEDTMGLKEGDSVACALTDGTQFTALVSFVSPVAHQSLSSIGLRENRCLVELTPKNLPKQAGAGFQADLTFTSVAARDVLSVPASALVPHEGGSAVYLVQNGKATLCAVETGLRMGGRVQLISGVSANDSIILNPYDTQIKQGKRVKSAN